MLGAARAVRRRRCTRVGATGAAPAAPSPLPARPRPLRAPPGGTRSSGVAPAAGPSRAGPGRREAGSPAPAPPTSGNGRGPGGAGSTAQHGTALHGTAPLRSALPPWHPSAPSATRPCISVSASTAPLSTPRASPQRSAAQRIPCPALPAPVPYNGWGPRPAVRRGIRPTDRGEGGLGGEERRGAGASAPRRSRSAGPGVRFASRGRRFGFLRCFVRGFGAGSARVGAQSRPCGKRGGPGAIPAVGSPRTPPPGSSARSLGAERPAVPARWRHREPSFLPGHLQVNTEIGICSLPPLNKPICGGGGRRWERLGLRRFSPCELFPFEAENSPLGTARGQRSSCPGGGRGCSPGLRGCGGLESP